MSKYSSRNYTYREALDALSELDRDNQQLRRQNRALNELSGERRDQKDAAIKETKAAKSRLSTLTRKQVANEKIKSTAGWSGAAIGLVTLVWQSPFITNLPPYLAESDFLYGGACWISTSLFAWAAKSFYQTT
tara:strand:+ start:467 stop:865 length:399 start_codon:yes stop_codon:yes gene_type:complete